MPRPLPAGFKFRRAIGHGFQPRPVATRRKAREYGKEKKCDTVGKCRNWWLTVSISTVCGPPVEWQEDRTWRTEEGGERKTFAGRRKKIQSTVRDRHESRQNPDPPLVGKRLAFHYHFEAADGTILHQCQPHGSVGSLNGGLGPYVAREAH